MRGKSEKFSNETPRFIAEFLTENLKERTYRKRAFMDMVTQRTSEKRNRVCHGRPDQIR